jgi:hypothetical protein
MHKQITFIKKATFVAFFVFTSQNICSQNTFFQDAEVFVNDLLVVSNRYVAPAADAAVYQSSGSWYSSARALGLYEIDASVHINVLPIPTSQQSFTVSNSDFNIMSIRGATTADVPTALGGDTEVFYDFVLGGDNYELQTFEGAKQGTFYYPYVQASIGFWRETELTLQYAPEIKIDDSGYQTFGGAIKHNLSQYWLGVERDNQQFEVAFQVAYSVFDSRIFFDDFAVKATNPDPGQGPLAIIQSLDVQANALTGQIIGSKRFNNLEVQGSLAVSSNAFDYTIGGEGAIIIDLFNGAFDALEDANTTARGNLGVNYHFGQFYVAGAASIGRFINTNLSIHYRI